MYAPTKIPRAPAPVQTAKAPKTLKCLDSECVDLSFYGYEPYVPGVASRSRASTSIGVSTCSLMLTPRRTRR